MPPCGCMRLFFPEVAKPMLHPADYVHYIETAGINKPLLARIALNALYDSDAFPVDLSELNTLDSRGGQMARAFLDWCGTDPTQFSSWAEDGVERLKNIVDPHRDREIE